MEVNLTINLTKVSLNMNEKEHVSKQVNDYLIELHRIVNRICFADMLSECLMECDHGITATGGLFKPDTAQVAGTHTRFHKIVVSIDDFTRNGEQDRIINMIHQCTHQCLWEYSGVQSREHYHKKSFVEKMYELGILCLDRDGVGRPDVKLTELKPETGRHITHHIVNWDYFGRIEDYMFENRIALPVSTIPISKKEPTRVTWECPKCNRKAMLAKNDHYGLTCNKCNVAFERKG